MKVLIGTFFITGIALTLIGLYMPERYFEHLYDWQWLDAIFLVAGTILTFSGHVIFMVKTPKVAAVDSSDTFKTALTVFIPVFVFVALFWLEAWRTGIETKHLNGETVLRCSCVGTSLAYIVWDMCWGLDVIEP